MRKHKLLLLAATFGVVGVVGAGATPAGAATEHCPDHNGNPGKVEGKSNDVVLPEGTKFCVKGSTEATGELIADGETTLFQYLGIGQDVSYYIVYSRPDIGVEPVAPSLKPPTCDAPGEITMPEKEGLEYSKKTVDGTVVVTVKAASGYYLDGDDLGRWEFPADDLAQLTENCAGTPPPPPVDTPPTVDAGGPLPPAQVPVPASAAAPAAETAATAAAPPAPTALPATGSTSWALALSALAMVAGGLGLRHLSRRTDNLII
jgi:LPXTG-motif cell wall-anchored protein